MLHFGIFSHLIFLCGANFLDSYHKGILSAMSVQISGAVYGNCNHPSSLTHFRVLCWVIHMSYPTKHHPHGFIQLKSISAMLHLLSD